MSIDNKVFPIFEGAQMRRRFTTEEEWKDWLRAHGAYGFRVAPYYSRCVVVFGADRYIETMKQLYGVDDREFIGDAGGWVTDMGYFDADRLVHGVFLPDKRLKAYLGDMTATQHSIQHANLDKLLNRMDAISSGFFGGVVSKVTSFLITALLLGLAAYGVKSGIGN